MDSQNYDIRYLPLFYDDLQNTVQYISTVLQNPQAAMDLVDKVEDAILKRRPFAESFRKHPSIIKRKWPYYAIYVGNCVIYYVVIEHRIMEVRRLLYKSQDRKSMI